MSTLRMPDVLPPNWTSSVKIPKKYKRNSAAIYYATLRLLFASSQPGHSGHCMPKTSEKPPKTFPAVFNLKVLKPPMLFEIMLTGCNSTTVTSAKKKTKSVEKKHIFTILLLQSYFRPKLPRELLHQVFTYWICILIARNSIKDPKHWKSIESI